MNKRTKLAKALKTWQKDTATPNWKGADASLKWEAESNSNHLLLFDEDNYPKQLKQLASPPPLLFAKGNLQLLEKDSFAIVGSRKPTPYGVNTSKAMARALSEKGFPVVSGLALGIDGAAHLSALEENGKTIAVLGTGIDRIYPHMHQTLTKRIADEGLLISQFCLNTPPKAQHFPQRNELISALSLGTIVIEAAIKSGSLITARCALNQGKEVFAVPGSLTNPLSAGCHHLIKQGAKLTETIKDVLEEFDYSYPEVARQKINKTQKVLENHLQNLVECVGYDGTPIENLLARSGLTLEQLLQDLLELELNGHIKAVSGGYVRLE